MIVETSPRVTFRPILAAIMLALLVMVSCTSGQTTVPTADYHVDLDPADFVAVVDNPYFPLSPGSRYLYEGETEDGLERVEIEILSATRNVAGIRATVLHDIVFLDDELVEETYDWFAQDKSGNVWYLGEDVDNYENGAFVDHGGAWEAGVDGAQPGIVMFGDPDAHLRESYRQEYYAGVAEDMADLLSRTESVAVPFGSFDNVLQTFDYTPLDPDAQEYKYYAAGIGPIKTVNLVTGEEFVLVDYSPAGTAGGPATCALGAPEGGIAPDRLCVTASAPAGDKKAAPWGKSLTSFGPPPARPGQMGDEPQLH